MPRLSIAVVGGGIAGLWQALTLARRGHDVSLLETSENYQALSCSWFAGGMLALNGRDERPSPLMRHLGSESLAIWKELFPGTIRKGKLMVSSSAKHGELERLAASTDKNQIIEQPALAEIEPQLSDYSRALYYPSDAHVNPRTSMKFLLDEARRFGAHLVIGANDENKRGDWIVDCRGILARSEIDSLRGVRGEMVVVKTRFGRLSRPVGFLNRTSTLYIVPWETDTYMIATSVPTNESNGPIVGSRSQQLLKAAAELFRPFDTAQILEFGVGVRPMLPEGAPRVFVRGRRIFVNGFYRDGFLLAPAVGELVARYIEAGVMHSDLFVLD